MMRRSDRVSVSAIVALTLLFALAILAALVPTCGVSAQVSQPNIIIILTDDQRSDDWQYLPNVQSKIAAKGVILPNFIATNPLCCPSRTSILRGQYSHNHGVLTNNPGFTVTQGTLDQDTIATRLQAAGYQTALIGKYLNGYDGNAYIPPGWDHWYGIGPGYFNAPLNDNGVLSISNQLSTLAVQDDAVEWIRQRAFAGEQFFAYITPFAPHRKSHYEPQYESLFPEFVGTERRDRLRSLMTVDEMVRRIIVKLTNSGQLENTYIFVTSDNGFLLGEHGLEKKTHPYEESVRVGGFVRGPGIVQGSTVNELVANIDLLPTALAIANASVPSFVDGQSALPLLLGQPVAWREAILIENYDHIPWRGYRTEVYKYFERDGGVRELYDLTVDPLELNNLASTTDTTAMSNYLDQLKVCTVSTCHTLEMSPP